MPDFLTERLKLSHRLQGLVNSLGDDIAEILQGSLDTVLGRIVALAAKSEETQSLVYKRKYLTKQREEISRVLGEIYADIGTKIENKAVETAKATPELTKAMLEKVPEITVEWGMPKLDKSRIISWFESSQIDGLYFNDWLKKLEQGSVDRIVRETRRSLILHEPYGETKKRIQAALGTSRRAANGLAQNSIFQAHNWAEREMYLENEEDLQGLRFVVELDRRTCPLCITLDNKIFPPREAPLPPLHWACRCMLFPVFDWQKGGKPYGKRIARMETEPRTIHHRDGSTSTGYEGYDATQVPATMTYNDWMQSMVESENPEDVSFAREALGPGRFNLLKSGKLKMESLYYRGKIRTLDQLMELI
jgi:SPP1 gp7 family putative phage head morphogenesis protein